MVACAVVDRPVVDPLVGEVSEAREALEGILADLRVATTLKAGEAALDAVAVLLGLPWACWVPDTSHPYELPQMDAYARAHGWPDELLKIWWSRHAALKMPFYIRCRFEQLPFLISLDHRHHLDPWYGGNDIARRALAPVEGPGCHHSLGRQPQSR